MKYTTEIEIGKPMDEVVALFRDPDHYKSWMEGLQSFKPLNGNLGEVGAKTQFHFKMGKREIEMLETVLTNDLPREYSVSYEAKGVFNIVTNRFKKLSETRTRYITNQEFRFQGFMKLLGWLMPGAFKKQSKKYLQDFKKFAETQ